MREHPGGIKHTEELLRLGNVRAGERVLDLGAGKGEALELLRQMGCRAEGMDLAAEGQDIRKGDFLKEESFSEDMKEYDVILSQCAFFESGDPEQALWICHKKLRAGGRLLLSDVSFQKENLWFSQIEHAGFSVNCKMDLTAQWKEYYIESIWRGTCEDLPECMKKIRKRMNYYAAVAERIENGFI